MECFICAAKIGRGNADVCRTIEEKMDKLISVSQRVEHSSTIISDILSRILNETVMKQETICRICFNLLNDIDYHLKEAQEKTDEITNKFLDRGKDPHSYQPQATIVCASTPASSTQQPESWVVSGLVTKPKLTTTPEKRKRREKSSKSRKSSRKHPPEDVAKSSTAAEDTDCFQTEEDENMSVNVINKSKAKLFSHILTAGTTGGGGGGGGGMTSTVYPPKKSRASHDVVPRSSKSTTVQSPPDKKQAKSISQINWSDDSSSDSEDESLKHKAIKKLKRAKNVQSDENTSSNLQDKSVDKSKQVTNADTNPPSPPPPKSMQFYAVKSEPQSKHKVATSKKTDGGGNNDGDQFVCEICNNKYKRALNLQLHMEKVHSILGGPEPPTSGVVPESHKCETCKREFTNVESLKEHMEDHEREKREAATTGLQNTHSNVKKPPPKPKQESPKKEPKAQCDICKQTFQRMFNLKTHINRVHNKVRDHKCTECPKAFATASDLRQHLASHGLGKVFTCDICSKTFHNRDSAIFHRKKHTQQYTHFCSICNKGFYKSSCVNRHMRTHTGEKPYNCDKCDKGFTQIVALKAHKLRCQSTSKGEEKSRQPNSDFIAKEKPSNV